MCKQFIHLFTVDVLVNLSSILIVFHRFFTWITLGDTDLCFSFIFLPKANGDEGGITWAVCLYHQCNQSVRVTDGMTVTLFSDGLQHKTSAATFHLCQIALYWRFSCIVFSKLCQTKHYHINLNSDVNFQVALKQNHTKKSHKKRLACIHLNAPP
jgi:hypothetical protein